MLDVFQKEGVMFSTLRTHNKIPYYAEIKSPTDFAEAVNYAKDKNLNYFILGGGSNVFFENEIVETFVLKNKLPYELTELGDDRYYVSSSVRIMDLLKYALSNSLDAPYFLASLPAEVGGILAMNAGGGMDSCVYNYVESVKFVDDKGEIFELKTDDLNVSYRNTIFLQSGNKYILGATFRFPKTDLKGKNPIMDRINFAKKYQDLSAPNVGCFYGPSCNRYILFICWKIFRFGKARFSKKEKYWLLNSEKNPKHMRHLVNFVKFLHKLFRVRYKPESIVIK